MNNTKNDITIYNKGSEDSFKKWGWKSSYSKNYDMMGRKNKTVLPLFAQICRMDQSTLKGFLKKEMKSAGYAIHSKDGYLYAEGSIPVLLTAHMDTVHDELIKDTYEYVTELGEHVLSSPQGIGGDDRCGVYMILKLIRETDMRPHILFCEDEEIGGVGSDKFCNSKWISKLDDLKFLIELDRANSNDAVFYNCDNFDFTEFIESETGYKEAWGSFSDISTLAPMCGVAAVNLSCGYYNAHTTHEYVVLEEMLHTYDIVVDLLNKATWEEVVQYEYIELKYNYGQYGSYYGNNRNLANPYSNNWYDDYDDWYDNAYDYYGKQNSKSNYYDEDTEFLGVEFILYVDSYETIEVIHGDSFHECLGKLLEEHSGSTFNDIIDYSEIINYKTKENAI